VEKMKAALYARVSLDESAQDKRYQEPENQLEPLREWCKEQGWEVVKEYVDRGSGANPARHQFREMMNDAMQRKFNVIVVWRLDRFSREGINAVLGYIQKLKDRGIGLKSQQEAWVDTSENNPMSEMIISIFAWVAQEERRKISERTKAGIQRRRNIGQWKGGRPKGSKDKKPRKISYLTHEQQLRANRKREVLV
jgi:DNA invertase Pin-like site-specific DNA recombinase